VTDLVVLGAGPAGLGAALRAARRGLGVTVIERSDVVGGAAGSFTLEGVRVDHGSHRLHPSIEPRVLAELQGLLGGDLERRERNGRIRLMDRWVSFPLKASDLVRAMPRPFLLRAGLDALRAPLRRARSDSFAEVLRAGLGPAICERFYFPYARKIWGVEPDELSAEQARRRVSADSPAKLLKRAIRGSGSGGAGGSGHFYYPRRGYGQISEALAEAATAAGANLVLGTEAGSVSLTDDGVTVAGPDGRTFEAARLWSTIPITLLARLARAPDEVLAAAAALEFRSMVLVYLVLGVDRYTPYDAHYLPEPFTPVTRVSEPKNYRSGDDPAGRTVLCAEIPCGRDDELWGAPDEALGEITAAGLRAAGLPAVAPVEAHVRRLPFAYPIYRRGYESHFEKLDRWAEQRQNLLTFGRQGLFAHDNAHHALAMAWAAADCLGPDGTFDDAAWRTARERFRSHVVED
jgi:protoporphyrinogen oxidase